MQRTYAMSALPSRENASSFAFFPSRYLHALARIVAGFGFFTEDPMTEPIASRPHWSDALSNTPDATTGLKPWSWALERLEKSHNYWISTAARGRPHLMVIWGIWWQDAFWFSTGLRTRKARNIAESARCVIGTEKADEAVIVEGTAQQISDHALWKQLAFPYDKKYGGELLPLLESSGGAVFRVAPQVAFGQDEHAENFVQSATRWKFE
jgi:hypothetical protein